MDSGNGWTKVCSLSDLRANELRPQEINGIPVLVVNGSSRRMVIPQSCPHMSNSLAEGVFDGHVLTCTKHLWQWSIDAGGEPVGMAEAPLLCYETRESDGDLHGRAVEELHYGHGDEDF
jgi:toluene monooxygenase system ferredoxin subunit